MRGQIREDKAAEGDTCCLLFQNRSRKLAPPAAATPAALRPAAAAAVSDVGVYAADSAAATAAGRIS